MGTQHQGRPRLPDHKRLKHTAVALPLTVIEELKQSHRGLSGEIRYRIKAFHEREAVAQRNLDADRQALVDKLKQVTADWELLRSVFNICDMENKDGKV